MSDPLLEVENLHTEFKTESGSLTAVNGVDFTLGSGEIMGLVGESGAGKSVTARSVMQLIESPGEISEGTIRLNGDDLLQKSEAELRKVRGGQMAMIFQDPLTALNPVFTVGSQIIETIQLHQPVSDQAAREQAIELLEQVGIPSPNKRIDDYPHEFSGGMRQRAVIAMALSCEPDLLIADEPTTALDVTIEAQILDLIEELSEEYGTSVLFITHDLGVVAHLCDKVGVMYSADLVEVGAVEDIYANPRHPYTQGLLASIPQITDARDQQLTTIAGKMPSIGEPPDGCRFHPRCPHAEPKCKSGYPPMDPVSEEQSHQTRCIRWEEVGITWSDTPSESLDRSIEPDAATLLEVQDLQKWFDADDGLLDKVRMGRDAPGSLPVGLKTEYVQAVDGIDFEIKSGETFGLVGESGCGKSTTAKSLIQLLEPTDGQVWFRTKSGDRKQLTELDRTELRSVRREMQIIFQDPQSSLNPRMSVGDIVGRPLELHDIATGEEKRERVEDLLETVGLSASDAELYPHEFSGGQQQRIGIARALAVEPEFLVCDEPVSALDVSIQAQILNLLTELQDEFDLTILFIAHDLSVVRHICDRIAVMYLGNIMEVGRVEDVFEPPYHPYANALLSAIPIADPTAKRSRVRLEGDVPSPIDPPSGCPFHTRCPQYIPGECDTGEPPLTEVDGGHKIACVLEEDELPAENIVDVHQTSSRASDD